MSDEHSIVASVIVLAYNDKEYLEGCLGSLLNQDYPAEAYELIYADNASTDGSANYVKEQFPTVKVIQFKQNYGFTEGNNKAAQFANGKYISFQNADTIAHKRWLPELISVLESDPNIKACHPAGLPLNFGGYNETEGALDKGVMCELTRFGYVDFTEIPLNGMTKPTLFIAGGSLLIDAEIHKQLGYYFDPSYFIYNEDTDLGLRINNLGYQVIFVSAAAAYHQRAPSRRTVLNKKGLKMAFLVTRNRFITFYKNMFLIEFLLALPLIFLGSIIKLRTLPMSLPKKIVFGIGLIPYTMFSFIMAVIRMPQYSGKRKFILGNRKSGRFWLLRELWHRPVPPPTKFTAL